MKTIDEIVALNVAMRMKELGLNQKELASMCEVTYAYLNKLLVGKKPISKSHKLGKIADILECTEVDLYQDPEKIAKYSAEKAGLVARTKDLKKLNKMVTNHFLETVSELKEAREKKYKEGFEVPEGYELVSHEYLDEVNSLLDATHITKTEMWFIEGIRRINKTQKRRIAEMIRDILGTKLPRSPKAQNS